MSEGTLAGHQAVNPRQRRHTPHARMGPGSNNSGKRAASNDARITRGNPARSAATAHQGYHHTAE